MNIQNSGVNFQARRVLNVRKAIQNGADEVIDVFALGKEDKKFIIRCNAALQGSDRSVVEANPSNINMLGGNIEKGYKGFYKDFLTCLSGKKPVFMPSFEDTHYYIAIKNGETISGVAEISDADFPRASLDRMIFTKKDKSLEESFWYGVLKDLTDVFRKEGQTGLSGFKKKVSKRVDENGYLDFKNFGKAQRSIALRNQDLEINRIKDPYQYDLEDFLGIKDFETEIMA